MQDTLKSFISQPLFDACTEMLSQLHVSFTPVTATPLPFTMFYKGNITKALGEVMEKIENTFYIGNIDNDTFSESGTVKDLETIQQNSVEGKYQCMVVFAVDIRQGHTLTKSECATLTRAFNRIARAQPVILFVREGHHLSLATCERMEYSQAWRDGQKMGKVSILRRINCQQTHRGHIDILNRLSEGGCTSFDELYDHWMEVFSSELLTKKFYNELSDWYAWAVMVARFPNDIRTNDDDEKYNHEACIRLITRLIFVWFLKQKHLIPDEFFDEKYICDNFIEGFNPHDRQNLYYNSEDSKYYRLILQNLFFAMLNCPIVAEGKKTPNNRRFRGDNQYGYKRDGYNINNIMRYKSEFTKGGAEKFVEIANSNVPFLNGGLFDCLDDKPKHLYYDGFSERKESLDQLCLPDYLFFGDEVGNGIDLSEWYGDKKKKRVSARGLIDILNRYCFTVEENTPYDQEVSLDPELLGKVFENLLAAYNPETKQSARKQTGSFYTPREIVQYMVDESLVAHLKRLCGDDMEAEYRSLLSYAVDEVRLTHEQRENIMKAIYNCRILDPACGSGAFPMGVLQKMVHVLKRIDPTNEMWNSLMIDMAVNEARKELKKAIHATDKEKAKIEENRKARLDDIENAFNQSINDPDYARKLYLIEHCIYGVDIQPIAIQISKLRFFISLVVDQKPTKDAKTNFGIRPLPNLEAKFVAANTLIPLDRTQNLFTSTDEIRIYEEQLQDINHRIFLAKRNTDKERLRAELYSTRAALAQTMENLGFIGTKGYDQLMQWDLFNQNYSASFFDPEWMFGVKGGFDIVIGNPPYVQLQANKGALAKMYAPYGFSTFAKTGDLYCLFYECGNNLLSRGGSLCYITSNKWMRAGYGETLRGYLTSHTNPTLLIDFCETHVFESACVMTNILIFKNEQNNNNLFATSTGDDFVDPDAISSYCASHGMQCRFEGNESWVIMPDSVRNIKKKVEAKGTPLKDWDIEINYGIKTGYNPAFIITTEKRNEIIAGCLTEDERKRTEEVIRPMLRGKDICKYGYDWADMWLIGTFPAKNLDINNYPSIERFLKSFGVERLEQTGKEYIINGEKVKARKKSTNEWFETQDTIKYWTQFASPKIIYPNMTKYMPFVYDESGILTNQKCFILTGEHISYLTAFLNSSLFKLCFFDNFPVLFGGSRELSKIFFDKIPILQVDDATDAEFRKLVLDIQDEYSDEKAKAIDQKIFDIYGLTQEERETIGYIDFHGSPDGEDDEE